MTIIVHPVGQGDLRNDIVRLSHEERKTAQSEAEQSVTKILEADDSDASAENLVAWLLKPPAGDSRFSAPPLSLILRALSCRAQGEPEGAVTILLLASRSGDPRTQTWGIGTLLKNALGRAGVRDRLRTQLGLDVDAEMLEISLFEAAGVKRLAEKLRELVASQTQRGHEPSIVVNAISGASMVALGAMGAADQLGLDWQAAVAPGADEDLGVAKDTAVLLDRSSFDTAPFYWLLSLGYVEQAREWAQAWSARSACSTPLRIDGLDGLTSRMERLATRPEDLDDCDLASLLALDMARADNGAGLVARAWMQKHYLMLHEKEAGEQQGAPEDLIAEAKRKRNGKPPQLGDVLALAQKRCDGKPGGQCPSSIRWLWENRWLNDVGTTTVHDLAAPSASEVQRALSLDSLSTVLPEWVARPGRGAVLFIVPCGAGGPRGVRVTERVLDREPDTAIRRAVPGGMLEGAKPLPVEFLFLHSSNSGSRKTAIDEAAASFTTQVNAGWERHTPILVNLCDYGGGDKSEYVATPSIMQIVSDQVALALEAKRPAAVVIVGTGQKAAVLGALQAAQKSCAKCATPLFLQTFIDTEKGKSVPQLHRLALHNDADAALRKAALISLRSLNLLSAIRVLAAGDKDMGKLADECDALRQQLLTAANATEDPDRGAGVLVDLLETVANLWADASELTKMRLAVVVAEALNFRTKGSNLLHRNNNLRDVGSGGIDLGRSYPKDDCKKKAKDKGPHQDLLEILYRVRNNLVVTHADGLVEPALRMVLEDLGVKNVPTVSGAVLPREDVTYPDVLWLTRDKLRKAAKVLKVDLNSTWKHDFEKLQGKIETRGKASMTTVSLTLVNLTPHDVVIDPGDGAPSVRFAASGTVPRILLSEPDCESLRIAGPGHPDGPLAVREVPLAVGAAWLGVDPPLPEPKADIMYITSRVVAQHFPDRTDLIWPDGLVRDERGEVVAARRFACLRSAEQEAMGTSE